MGRPSARGRQFGGFHQARLSALCAAAVAALCLAACGTATNGNAPAPAAPTTPKPADFPAVKGRSLKQVFGGLSQGPILALSVHELNKGANRVGFVLFDAARKQLDVPAVAVYTAAPDGTRAAGPFVARKETLAVDTQYRSAQTASDLANGDTFYVADVPFRRNGTQVIVGLAKLDGRLVVANPSEAVDIGSVKNGPPGVGQKAIPVHTLTGADVGGDLAKISTRVPPPKEMLSTDFDSVLHKKPVVLLFATPALCQSRTCGPVVDIADQVRAQYGKGVTFIQQEIYKNNQIAQGFRPQVGAWRLQTEPWAFVIDKTGRVRARFEGVFSVNELARAVQRVKQ